MSVEGPNGTTAVGDEIRMERKEREVIMAKIDDNIIDMVGIEDVLVQMIGKINGLVIGYNEIIKRLGDARS